MESIYIIKNSINNKVYIGQSKDVPHRWQQHISAAKHNFNSPLYVDMRKYGIDKFYYQILEPDVNNGNEREEYWIEYYNSQMPNGYNLSGGGQMIGFRNTRTTFMTKEDFMAVVNLIQNTNITFNKIAEIYDCSPTVISSINLGFGYRDRNLNYPLRENRYSKEKIKQIVYSLKYEKDKTMADIAREYNVDGSQLTEINSGKIHRIPNTDYPIRHGKEYNPCCEHVDEIIDLLKHSDMQQKDIARKFNVSVNAISGINKGKNYKRENEEYPIRKNYQCSSGGRKCFSPDEIREIEKELRDADKSMRQIAAEYECGLTTIININNGAIIKYRNNIEYPIRKGFIYNK